MTPAASTADRRLEVFCSAAGPDVAGCSVGSFVGSAVGAGTSVGGSAVGGGTVASALIGNCNRLLKSSEKPPTLYSTSRFTEKQLLLKLSAVVNFVRVLKGAKYPSAGRKSSVSQYGHRPSQ